MSQPPGPANPYGDPQQPYGGGQPYGYPQTPPNQPNQPNQPPQPGPYGQQQPYGYPQQGIPPQPGYPQQFGQQGGYPPPPAGYLPGMPPLASWGARLGATLLDFLMFFLLPVSLATAGYLQIVIKAVTQANDCTNEGISSDVCPTTHVSGASTALIVVGLLLIAVALVFICYREGATGQTPGKRIVGIRILKEQDGATLGFGLALGRRLLHILDNLACYLGWLWPLWDEKNQTFADKIVNSVVIKDQS